MTATTLQSPCKECKRRHEDKDECSPCQKTIDYLHIMFGEPWYDLAAWEAQQKAELAQFLPDATGHKKCNFYGRNEKARHFSCPICKAETWTSHNAAKTCGKPECKQKYEIIADTARRERNREKKNARARERRKRLRG